MLERVITTINQFSQNLPYNIDKSISLIIFFKVGNQYNNMLYFKKGGLTMKSINITSEVGKLKQVLVHRPGFELENLTPKWLELLLFDDIP